MTAKEKGISEEEHPANREIGVPGNQNREYCGWPAFANKVGYAKTSAQPQAARSDDFADGCGDVFCGNAESVDQFFGLA
jgi:hypothetical protein